MSKMSLYHWSLSVVLLLAIGCYVTAYPMNFYPSGSIEGVPTELDVGSNGIKRAARGVSDGAERFSYCKGPCGCCTTACVYVRCLRIRMSRRSPPQEPARELGFDANDSHTYSRSHWNEIGPAEFDDANSSPQISPQEEVQQAARTDFIKNLLSLLL
ncbi:uncharacterized protein [Ptychodera flava]|uniref:uncharacterized protein isoform X2 n=1 Tax=Ptychodera flava TaxID=63121 RepID=UPI00396A91D5